MWQSLCTNVKVVVEEDIRVQTVTISNRGTMAMATGMVDTIEGMGRSLSLCLRADPDRIRILRIRGRRLRRRRRVRRRW